jgi:predicted transcriptional regulator
MVWIPRDITNTELAVLRLLWKLGSSTIRELTDQLYPEGGHSHYATVQSLLDRLEQKGCVSHQKQGRCNLFTASISRSELISRRLHETAEALCDGSLAPLLTQLIGSANLDEDEVAALSSLVDRLERESVEHEPEEELDDDR